MDDLSHILALVAAVSSSVGRDIWDWCLDNINMIAIVGAYRFWSMSEHRKTAEQLKRDRAALAQQIAELAAFNVAKASKETATLAQAVQHNTDAIESKGAL